MKKSRFSLLFVIGFLTVQSQAQEVSTKQKPLFTKLTATWCPNCGTWGWTYMKNVVEDNANDALIVGAHFSGALSSTSGGFLQDNFGSFSQPRFIFGNADQGVNRNNIGDKAVETRNLVVSEIGKDARIGVGVEARIAGDQIVANSNTQSFTALDGDFYLALYVVEDKVIEVQSSVGADAEHPFVIRRAMSAEDFGAQLFSGPTTSFEQSGEHSLSIDPSWNTDNLYVYAMIWRKEENTYIYENGSSTKVAQMSTSARDEGLQQVLVYPTVSQAVFHVEAPAEMVGKLEVEVRDLNGQLIDVPPLRETPLRRVDLSHAASGYYLIHLKHTDGQRTVRVLKQ
ncbi:MAG: Omp28-related outer membrane protein [Saprospiraceae bacterium]|nr:Omp28-related outer membrane protein [Saprospiraceae bacterium]